MLVLAAHPPRGEVLCIVGRTFLYFWHKAPKKIWTPKYNLIKKG